MKKHPIYHWILLICTLLLGTVVGSLGADPTNPRAPTRSSGPRIEKDTGIFSRLFGRRLVRNGGAPRDDDDDDDDDDDEEDEGEGEEDEDDKRFRSLGPQFQYPPVSGRIIITTRTNGEPIRSEYYPDPHRYPHLQEGTRRIAPPTWQPLSDPRDFQPAPPPPAPRVHFDERYQRVPDQTRTVDAPARIVIVPSGVVIVPTTPPSSRQFPVSPPRTTTFAPTDRLTDPPTYEPPPQYVPPVPMSVFPPEVPAPLPATPSSPSLAEQTPISATPSPGPPSAMPPSAESPASPPLPPFATPVPGRPGLVYAPGQEATRENITDVTNFARGTKVRDPVSNVIFRVP